jgi:hypothetical protein
VGSGLSPNGIGFAEEGLFREKKNTPKFLLILSAYGCAFRESNPEIFNSLFSPVVPPSVISTPKFNLIPSSSSLPTQTFQGW